MSDAKYKQIPCDHWNYSTICCYRYKGKCDLCPNDYVCSLYDFEKNKYGIRPVKYAMLLTYSALGKPRGKE